MSEEGQRLESSEDYHLSSTDPPSPNYYGGQALPTTILSAMSEAEMQFSLTRSAPENRWGAKEGFLYCIS